MFTGISSISLRETKLTGVTLPNGVTSLGYMSVAYANRLATIVLPVTFSSIGTDCFWDAVIDSFTVLAAEPPTLQSNALRRSTIKTIYVPSESVDAYKSAWSAYASKIQAIPG